MIPHDAASHTESKCFLAIVISRTKSADQIVRTRVPAISLPCCVTVRVSSFETVYHTVSVVHRNTPHRASGSSSLIRIRAAHVQAVPLAPRVHPRTVSITLFAPKPGIYLSHLCRMPAAPNADTVIPHYRAPLSKRHPLHRDRFTAAALPRPAPLRPNVPTASPWCAARPRPPPAALPLAPSGVGPPPLTRQLLPLRPSARARRTTRAAPRANPQSRLWKGPHVAPTLLHHSPWTLTMTPTANLSLACILRAPFPRFRAFVRAISLRFKCATFSLLPIPSFTRALA